MDSGSVLHSQAISSSRVSGHVAVFYVFTLNSIPDRELLGSSRSQGIPYGKCLTQNKVSKEVSEEKEWQSLKRYIQHMNGWQSQALNKYL